MLPILLFAVVLSMQLAARADGLITSSSGDDRSFSPNGDGQEDAVQIRYCLSSAANIDIAILGGGGTLVRSLETNASRPSGCSFFTWDGRNDAGQIVPNGTYTYRIHAEDAGGATGDAEGQLGVDTRIPGRITQPSPNDTLSGTTDLVFTPTAGFTGITGVCSPTGNCSATPETNGTYLATLETRTLPDGPYAVQASVSFTDSFGATHSYTSVGVPVTISNPPRITRLTTDFTSSPDRSFSPNDDGQEDEVRVGYCLSEDADLTITIRSAGGGVVRTIESAVSHTAGSGDFGFCDGSGFNAENVFTWDGRNDAGQIVPNGTYTYRIHAEDAGGATGDAEGQLGVDTRIPGRITQPSPNDTLSGTTDLVFTPTAGFTGITGVCSPTGNCSATPETNGTYLATLETRTLPDGPYAVQASVSFTDSFGATHSYTSVGVPVTISNPPRITRLTTDFTSSPDRSFSPNDDGQEDEVRVGYCLSEDADLTITIRSAGGGVVRTIESAVSHTAGSGDFGFCDGSGFNAENVFTWDGRNDAGQIVPNGTYTYRIHAEDAGGATGDAEGQLGVDTRIPGRITQPSPNDTLSGTTDLVFTPTAGFTGITGVCSPTGNCSATPETNGTYLATLETRTLPDGPYAVQASVSFTDSFGATHSYTSVGVPVTISNPPRITRLTTDFTSSPDRSFSPNDDGQEDEVRVGYCLSEDADLTITIRSAGGGVVRTIESAVSHTAGSGDFGFCDGSGFNAENVFTWDGRNDAGQIVPNGTYTYRIHAEDAGGATGDAEGQLGVDTRIPGRITQPSPNDTLSGTTDLVFTPTAGFTGITGVNFCFGTRCATVFAPAPSGAWRTTLDTTSVPDGPATLTTVVSITDSFGQSHSYVPSDVNVVIDQTSPALTLLVDPDTGDAPLHATLSIDGSSPTNATLSYTLSFGDGSNTEGSIPPPYDRVQIEHDYMSPGAFTAVAAVSDGAGHFAQRSATITVTGSPNEPPSASLEVAPTSGTAPLDVTATIGGTDPDVGDNLTYELDFGDGSAVLTGDLPSEPIDHTYTAAGDYTVRLEVSDGTAADAATVSVTVTGSPNEPPSASLEVAPTSGTAPLDVTATIGGTDPDVGDNLTYELDFGDGSAVLTGDLPSEPIDHTYTAAGDYTVRLEVSDGTAADAATVSVTVTGSPNEGPSASLEVAPTSGAAPLDVTATIGGTDPDVGDILTYELDFGDGSAVLTGDLPSEPIDHTYTAAGDYTVRLEVSDGTASDVQTRTVSVQGGGNHQPYAVDDRASVRGGARTIDVLSNDTDVDGDALSIVAFDSRGGESYMWCPGVRLHA